MLLTHVANPGAPGACDRMIGWMNFTGLRLGVYASLSKAVGGFLHWPCKYQLTLC